VTELFQQMANVAVGGILALLIIREVFDFIRRRNGERRRRDTPPGKSLHSTDAIIDRLDRIIDRLDELADCMREARRQAELNGEAQDRIKRHIGQLEQTLTIIEKTVRHRQSEPLPLKT
jgi:hypothetical protein